MGRRVGWERYRRGYGITGRGSMPEDARMVKVASLCDVIESAHFGLAFGEGVSAARAAECEYRTRNSKLSNTPRSATT